MSADRLPGLQRLAQGALRSNAELLYRHTLTFTLGTSSWEDVRCSVQDPQKLKADAVARLQATAAELNVSYRDLRVLRVYPDDTPPYPGATAPWDDGTLEVLDWSQPSDFTGQRVGTCVLRRP